VQSSEKAFESLLIVGLEVLKGTELEKQKNSNIKVKIQQLCLNGT